MADVPNISNGTNGSYNADAVKNAKNNTATQKSKNKYSLDMEDFMQLLVKQLSNQDMMNPMDDSQMVAQMAQMATVQAMNQFSEITTTTYAASLVGKEVVMADTSEGTVKEITGTVTGAGFYGGEPVLFVDGKSFYLNQMMAVGKLPEKEDPDEGDGDTENPDGGKDETGDKTDGTEKA